MQRLLDGVTPVILLTSCWTASTEKSSRLGWAEVYPVACIIVDDDDEEEEEEEEYLAYLRILDGRDILCKVSELIPIMVNLWW